MQLAGEKVQKPQNNSNSYYTLKSNGHHLDTMNDSRHLNGFGASKRHTNGHTENGVSPVKLTFFLANEMSIQVLAKKVG